MRSTKKYRDSKTRVVSTIQVRIDGEDQSHRALRHAFEDLARAEQSHLHCGLSWSTRTTPATTTKWLWKMMMTCPHTTLEVPDGRHISVLRNLRLTRWRHFSSNAKWSAINEVVESTQCSASHMGKREYGPACHLTANNLPMTAFCLTPNILPNPLQIATKRLLDTTDGSLQGLIEANHRRPLGAGQPANFTAA